MKTEHDFQRYQPGNGSAQDHYRLTGQAGTLCDRCTDTGLIQRAFGRDPVPCRCEAATKQ